MSLRRVDARFLLPRAPRTAVVVGGLPEWRQGLVAAGIEVAAEDGRGAAPDLAVSSGALARRAVASQPSAVLLEGAAGRPLRGSGIRFRRLLARPRKEDPALFLPLREGPPARYAVDSWSVVDRRWKRVRMAVARELAARGALPALGQGVIVGARAGTVPYLVAAAAERLELPGPLASVLSLGQGDSLSRNVFHLFPAGAATPAWVIKFARVPGYREPFDRDQRGLASAAAGGALVASRAPRLLARFDHDGLECSVETAAVGRRLRERLQEPGGRREKLELIERVATWIIDMGRATASPPEATQEELLRLKREVLPRWPAADSGLVDGLPSLPGVLQHNDLGSWNLVVRDRDFTVLDWESSRRHGMPLWDLLYFLADTLAVLEGVWMGEERARHTIRLFRGGTPSSPFLFSWTRRAARTLELPRDAIAPLATLCWLHHSLSHVARRSALDRLAPGSSAPLHGMENIGPLWLADPVLRRGWTAWEHGA